MIPSPKIDTLEKDNIECSQYSGSGGLKDIQISFQIDFLKIFLSL
jgi:hypothetical protein